MGLFYCDLYNVFTRFLVASRQIQSFFLIAYRGQLRSLWVGLLVALPSGAAVAIGILGDNTASLVGVAISASLLPPAVNAVCVNPPRLIYVDEGKCFGSVTAS
jgi:hypothetical protein